MQIPTIVVASQQVLGLNLLGVLDDFAACLPLDVVRDSSLADWIRKNIAAEDMLHWRRRDNAITHRIALSPFSRFVGRTFRGQRSTA